MSDVVKAKISSLLVPVEAVPVATIFSKIEPSSFTPFSTTVILLSASIRVSSVTPCALVNSSTLEPSAFSIFVVGSPFASGSIVVVVSTTRPAPTPVEISVTSLPVLGSVTIVSILPVTEFVNSSVIKLVVESTVRVPLPITLVIRSPLVLYTISETVTVLPSVTNIFFVPSKFVIVSVVTPDAVSIKTWVPSFSTKLLLERVDAPEASFCDVVTTPSAAVTIVSDAPVAMPDASNVSSTTVTTFVLGSTTLVPVDAKTTTGAALSYLATLATVTVPLTKFVSVTTASPVCWSIRVNLVLPVLGSVSVLVITFFEYTLT